MTGASAGFHATACTLSLWWRSVCLHSCRVTSQTFTVWSALALARTLRYSEFQLSPSTASSWLPGTRATLAFFFFFFSFFFSSRLRPLLAPSSPSPAPASGGRMPPSEATGSTASMRSRSHSSISGLKVPTATKLRESGRPPGSQSSQASDSGKYASMTSWCTYKLASPPGSRASSYSHTSSVLTSSSLRAARMSRSLSRMLKSSISLSSSLPSLR
mmetsp:Transcript_21135/g.54184  ORF Transcript_21135/g.54184 Transcript_21135/m.54184 type:complete len:216 (+) Transcript_21135:636-1283(+)